MNSDDKKVTETMRFILDRLRESKYDFKAAPHDTDYTLSEEDIAFDLKLFAEEVYNGKVSTLENFVDITFSNGETFRILIQKL